MPFLLRKGLRIVHMDGLPALICVNSVLSAQKTYSQDLTKDLDFCSLIVGV